MEKIDNWEVATRNARERNLPLVILVDQADCPYCRVVEGEFFAGILASGEYRDKALIGKISLDAGEFITLPGGRREPTRDFLLPFEAGLTPTVLFLDAEGNELVDKMIGLLTPDFYGFYLEQSIRRAHTLLNG